jgi:hypothetical protein
MLVTTARIPPQSAKVLSIRDNDSQLQSLYARKTAVEALIHSLETYQRVRAQRMERQESKKTA